MRANQLCWRRLRVSRQSLGRWRRCSKQPSRESALCPQVSRYGCSAVPEDMTVKALPGRGHLQNVTLGLACHYLLS